MNTSKDFENIQVRKDSGVKQALKVYCAKEGLTFTEAIKKLLHENQ